MNIVSANLTNHLSNFSLDKNTYLEWYKQSLNEPEKFWTAQANQFIQWLKPFKEVYSGDFSSAENYWFSQGQLNASQNCLDKHLQTSSNKPAFIWVADNSLDEKIITYKQLHEQVCRFANTLKSLGIKKGETVCIYMPMILEAIVAMLACTRIGAVHTVVFAGFSPKALKERILAADCKLLVTANNLRRGGKIAPLKKNVDEALKDIDFPKVVVVNHVGPKVAMRSGRDLDYASVLSADSICEPEALDSEDPLFILYTSGSTGKPKGIMHTHAGYLLYSAMTFKYVFDYQENDVYWCSADIGWITGHSYSVYGPLINGATSVIYEGVPTGPDPSHVWKIIDKFKVSIFYTAPTAIRALMSFGDTPLKNSKRDSLRILGTVGEPINPEAWRWYFEKVGNNNCWVVDTWWQTETGGICLVPLPNIGSQKPGSASIPFFGIEPAILAEDGTENHSDTQGFLVLKRSWPGQSRTIYGDHKRYLNTYMSQYPGYYFSGDGAYKDQDGDYWVIGRVDDVMNVSGHRIGTAELESALVEHSKVSEAAVISVKDEIKGEIPYAFIFLNQGEVFDEALVSECKDLVVKHIGKFALPKFLHWAPELPKTRSGKIMRRILRVIASQNLDNLGDTSTLANPDCIDKIIAQKPK
jgi:acetyl-CoA synthetase